jgi:UDP-N-acetylglucosamine 2-epimerase (non-hydrolysing)
MLVIGTRPEAIKIAPLFHALKKAPESFDTLLCITGQHRHMLHQVLRIFEITPDIDLDLMKDGQDLFDITSTILLNMRIELKKYMPDIVLVHGDTTTTLATSIAAFYLHIPIGHIEAGLRTHDLQAPFPEEFNRQVCSKLTKWHFAPTNSSRDNLLSENIPISKITVTGNTVIDALFWALDRIDKDKSLQSRLTLFLNEQLGFDFQAKQFILITGHRRENFGDGFLDICNAIKELAILYPNVEFVYPMHLNPNVQKPVKDILSGLNNVRLISPLDYEPFIFLLRNSYIVLTDSGGIQEEAPSLGKPVLVMRALTERPEAVNEGTVRLVGTDKKKIMSNIIDLLDNRNSYLAMSKAHNPYGDGRACERIISVLKGLNAK